jgi:hypothetical protein
MQKIILLIGIIFLSFNSYSENPPAAVQKAFNTQFTKASNVKWGKEDASEYEAEFMLNGVKMSANYSVDGSWLETETELAANQIPAVVSAYIAKTYPGWEIVGVSRIETSEKAILYEADLKSGKQKKEITLTSEGVPVS